MSQTNFISTLTLAELLGEHPPSRRPVFLSRFGGYQPGLMTRALIERIQEVRGPIEDLMVAAGGAAESVSAAQVALFHAQSRFWLREGADPTYVNLGVAWAREAGRVVEKEFGAVQVGKVSATATGEQGTDITVAIDNAAGQPMSLALEVVPTEGGDPLAAVERTVEVGSGTVSLERAEVPGGNYLLTVRAGNTQLVSAPFSVRREGTAAWWLWAAGVLAVCAAVAATATRRRRRAQTPRANREPAVREVRRGPS